MGERFEFTDEVLDKAVALRKSGLIWDEIAAYLGCKANTLQQTLSKRKHGKNKGMTSKWKTGREAIENGIGDGKSVAEIALELNRSKGGVYVLLWKMGIDRQERKEMRRRRREEQKS